MVFFLIFLTKYILFMLRSHLYINKYNHKKYGKKKGQHIFKFIKLHNSFYFIIFSEYMNKKYIDK